MDEGMDRVEEGYSAVPTRLTWNAFTHWGNYHHPYIAAIVLSLLTIVLCYLREKSDSLWDCILCHFAFNASSLSVGNVLR
jgi:membrane protease YdiL (CAAX protease family)